MYRLGAALESSGDAAGAAVMLTQALEMQQRIHKGADHLDLLPALINVVRCE
jgi:hypothetical protein